MIVATSFIHLQIFYFILLIFNITLHANDVLAELLIFLSIWKEYMKTSVANDIGYER